MKARVGLVATSCAAVIVAAFVWSSYAEIAPAPRTSAPAAATNDPEARVPVQAALPTAVDPTDREPALPEDGERNAGTTEIVAVPTERQLASFRRLAAIARARGVTVPSNVSGPHEMWQALEDVDAAYGVPYKASVGIMSYRMAHVVNQMDKSSLVPMDPANKARRDEGAADRVGFLGMEGKTYRVHVEKGQDPEMDKAEMDMLQYRAAAIDGLASILERYRLQRQVK